MGTRGAIGWHKDGEDKIAYNGMDSYPSYLGVSMLKYAGRGLVSLNADFDDTQIIDDETRPTKEQIERCIAHESVDLSVSEQNETDWYCLLRNVQGDLEGTADLGYMVDYSQFLRDSVFCEWAYIVNLDTEMLECYSGWRDKKPSGRYGEITQEAIDHQLAGYSGNVYYGVGLLKAYPLAELPDEEAFVEELDRLAQR